MYDLAGRVTSEAAVGSSGARRTTVHVLDAAGNVTARTAPTGNVDRISYDALSRPTSVIEGFGSPAAATTSVGYDVVGQQVRVTDELGRVTWTDYNANGLPVRLVEPSTPRHPNLTDRRWQFEYDDQGRMRTLARPGGLRGEYEYFPDGSVQTEVLYGAGRTSIYRLFEYDIAGNVSRANASTFTTSSTVELSWTQRGQLDTSYDVAESGTRSLNAEYTYDSDGLVRQRWDSQRPVHVWDRRVGPRQSQPSPHASVSRVGDGSVDDAVHRGLTRRGSHGHLDTRRSTNLDLRCCGPIDEGHGNWQSIPRQHPSPPRCRVYVRRAGPPRHQVGTDQRGQCAGP